MCVFVGVLPPGGAVRGAGGRDEGGLWRTVDGGTTAHIDLLIYYFFMKFILRAAPHLSKCISHVLSVIQGSDSL